MMQLFLRTTSQNLCRRCIDTILKKNAAISGVGYNILTARSFHVTPFESKSWNEVNKRDSTKANEKLEMGFKREEQEDETDLAAQGILARGIYLPTLETHEMLINGVPFKELPIVYIKSTSNNTIVTATDYKGSAIYAHSSGGVEGFRNAKKGSNVAAQATGMSVGYKTHRQGITHIRIVVKGLGVGRLPAVKGLKQSGLKIVSITDNTAVFSNGPKPRKAKRG